MALWEKSGKTVYIKQADATGRPTLTVYDLHERHLQAPGSVFEEGGKTTLDYATKADVERVASILDKLRADVDALKEESHE